MSVAKAERCILDARSMLARLADEVEDRLDVGWVVTDLDEVRAVLSDAAAALERTQPAPASGQKDEPR